MKRKIIKLTAIILTLSACFSFYASSAEDDCLQWYAKRRGDSLPEFPAGAEMLSEYNCYYMNQKCYSSGEKRIYLTFDAGYENGNIEKILDTLKEEDVPAAFFILDNIILKNADLVNRMTDEGHLVCNHTKRHKNLSFASKEEIKRDLMELEDICYNKTGKEMSKFFRFPEGKYSLEAVQSVAELGYTTVFWSFGYEDWDNGKQPDPERAKKKILSATHSGEILLLHPTSKTNAVILKDLITEWRKMGYSFGSLEELVG